MKIMIAMPCLDQIDTPTVQSLLNLSLQGAKEGFALTVQFCAGSLIYDARNIIANAAIDREFDRVLWLDSDMVFTPDILKRLAAHEEDYVSALAFRRKPPYLPVIYSSIGYRKDDNGIDIPALQAYEDYPENSFFEIAGSGFGCVMMSVKLLKECRNHFGLPFSPRLGFGEDITFCIEAQELGYKMYCDSSVKVGHLGRVTVDEDVYRETRKELGDDAKILDNHSGT